MRLALIATIISGAVVFDLCAQIVVVNDDVQFMSGIHPLFGPGYSLSVRHSNSLWLRHDPASARITLVGTTALYPETQLFVVSSGDLFTESAIAAGRFPRVGAQTVGGGASGFHLGIAVLSEEFIDQIGWIHLRPRLSMISELEMVRNAMSYSAHGIIIGTTTIVPEPTTILLMAIVAVSLLSSRRRF